MPKVLSQMKQIVGIGLLVGGVVGIFSPNLGWGHSFVIDQRSDAFAPFQGFTGNSQTGQEFIPTQLSMNVVELQINDQSLGDGIGISMFVRIREGAMNGVILGTSVGVALPDFSPAPFISPVLTHFDFPAMVVLTPGNTYVMEVVNTSLGDIGVFATSFNQDRYALGEAYFLGQLASISTPSNSPVDLWFRQGLASVPEPGTALLVGSGLLGLAAFRRHGR
jgi:hypothetical protein